MRIQTLLALVVAFYTSLVASAQSERTVEIFAWPLSQTKSQTLAQISYTSTNATVKKSSIPKIPAGEDIVRIGFHHASAAWSGIATSASNLAQEKDKKIILHLNSNGELYHIGFKASNQPSASKTGKGKDGLSVAVEAMKPGPTPHLNKPVVLNAEGKVDEQEPEKTFFQKYWWVFAGFVALQLISAVGGKD